MSGNDLPADIAALLAQRGEARERRDWEVADSLRDQLRDLGWEPIDGPRGSTARPVLPAVPAEDHASRLDEAPTVAASVVTVVDDHPEDLARLLDGMAAHRPAATWEILVVANAPAADTRPAAADLPVSWLRASDRLGWADAVNLGMHRAMGAVIVLLDSSLEPRGAWLDELLTAFGDPSVGIAGPWGVTSGDMRQFEDAPPGEVDAIEGYCLAVRREALRQVRGFDHRFRFYRNADLDLSFAVRAGGWRAVRTAPLPFERHLHRGYAALPEAERDRLSKRNFYRFLKHWGDRRDLLVAPVARDERGRSRPERKISAAEE